MQSGWPTFKTRFSIQFSTSSIGPVALCVSLLTLAYELKTRVICEVVICELRVNTLEKYHVLKKPRELLLLDRDIKKVALLCLVHEVNYPAS